MYLNNVGIRKVALILGASFGAVSKWIRNAHKLLQELLNNFNPLVSEKTDTIELDEMYTYVKKKKNRAIVWTAYSRRQKRVLAYTIGEGVKKAIEIYLKVKTMVGKILQIYSDALKITLDLFFYKDLILSAMKS